MFESLTNFRDFGSYTTLSGNKVKKGFLFRSDAPCNLSDDEQQLLTNFFHINTVVDLRSRSEIEGEPDRLPSSVQWISIPAKAKLAEAASESKKLQGRLTTYERLLLGRNTEFEHMESKMIEMMRSFISDEENRKVYGNLLNTYISYGTQPILQHCRGGKDRTGFGVALIQMILGISWDDIMAEYLLSNSLKEKETKTKMAQYRSIVSDEILLDSLHSMLVVKEDYLLAAFDEIEKLYGNFDNYLVEGLNFSKEKQNQLQSMYLVRSQK